MFYKWVPKARFVGCQASYHHGCLFLYSFIFIFGSVLWGLKRAADLLV